MTNKVESRNLILAKLKVSSDNTRKTNVLVGHEQMVASIEAKGQLTPIIVHVSTTKGMFEITDGQRRFLACQALQEQGKLPKNFTMRCEIGDADNAQAVSLATNVVRVAMHPADEFRAFNAVAIDGSSVSEIATQFATTEKKVEQRLRLANAAPEIFQAYRDGIISLDILQVYCVTPDQERQLSVFKALGENARSGVIRSRLTEENASTRDQRVRFITLEAYVEKGGEVESDLFSDHQYLTNIELLDQLATQKADEMKQSFLDEGWATAEFFWARSDFDENTIHEVAPSKTDLCAEDEQELERLNAECEPYSETNDLSDEEWDLVDSLRDKIEILEAKRFVYTLEQKAGLGVVLIIDGRGDVDVNLGLAEGKSSAVKAPSGPKTDYSQKHIDRLAGHRTLVMRCFLEQNPDAAEVLLLAELAECHFKRCSTRLFSGLRTESVKLGITREELHDIAALSVMEEVEAGWAKSFDKPEADYIGIVTSLSDTGRKSLLAFLMASRLDVTTHYEAPTQKRIEQAATLIGGDYANLWQPTADGHFRHISKDQIGKTVEEACGPEKANSLNGMSKKDMVVAAERTTLNSGWLPKTMRVVNGQDPDEIPALQAAE